MTVNIEQIFKDLSELPCWGVKWDADLNLSMKFGRPFLNIDEPNPNSKRFTHKRIITIEGEWFLWIMSGHWELSGYDFDTVRYSTPYKRKLRALYKLDGQKIVQTTVNPLTAVTQWEFDLGGRLSVRRKKVNNEDCIWSLYCPNNYAVSMMSNGKYEYSKMERTIGEVD